MKIRLITAFWVLSFLLIWGCKKSTEPLAQPFDDVVPFGTWVYSAEENGVTIYYLAEAFEKNNSGIAFKNDNVYIERSFGWCATPPLAYSNIKGKWELTDDNKLKVTCCGWLDGEHGRIVEIVSRSAAELKVIFHRSPEWNPKF
jgi:hypothetical protein